jgi:hypothetical protein
VGANRAALAAASLAAEEGMMRDELPLLTFRDAATFDSWLTDQPEDAGGAWLRFAKKGAPEQTISKCPTRSTAPSLMVG